MEKTAYDTMNMFRACSIAEGFCGGEDASEEEQQAAWQWLYDQKAYLHLQGWYGRTMQRMLEDGYIVVAHLQNGTKKEKNV
jgi:hypothetical protein